MSRLVGEEEWDMTATGQKFSSGCDKHVVKLDYGDGCTTL